MTKLSSCSDSKSCVNDNSRLSAWKIVLIIVAGAALLAALTLFITRIVLKAVEKYEAANRQRLKEKLNRLQKKRIRHILRTRKAYLKQQLRGAKNEKSAEEILSDFDNFIPEDLEDLDLLDEKREDE